MTGIIAAMEAELQLLKGNVEGLHSEKIAGQEYITGKLAGKAVVLAQCGIGKVHAALGAAFMIQAFSPKQIINTGSAGGLLANQTFGDIVLATALRYHDVDVTAFGYEIGQLPHCPPSFKSDIQLLEKAQSSVRQLQARGQYPKEVGIHIGEIGSGDVFVHEPDRIAAIKANFPTLLAVEMEGAAIAHVAHRMQLPFLVVRALSDIAGKESPMSFPEFLPLASKNSATLIMEMLASL